jgi:hypothetical protein
MPRLCCSKSVFSFVSLDKSEAHGRYQADLEWEIVRHDTQTVSPRFSLFFSLQNIFSRPAN